jgi:hypothetical protein
MPLHRTQNHIPSRKASGKMDSRLFSRRVRGVLILAAFNAITCAQSLPAAADSDIVTDRPDVTESLGKSG